MSKKVNKIEGEASHIENSKKLFEFLEQLALLNVKIRKDLNKISAEESAFDVSDRDIFPDHKNILLRNRNFEDSDDNVFLSIQRCKIEKSPKLPEELGLWLPEFDDTSFTVPKPKNSIWATEYFNEDKNRVTSLKKLNAEGTFDDVLEGWVTQTGKEYSPISERQVEHFLEEFPELSNLYESWFKSKWEPWRERNSLNFIVNQTYDKIYALRSFLKTESDSFDLFWGHDVFVWREKDIYHPSLFTLVQIELDTEHKTIKIKKAESAQSSFLDIGFIREDLETNLIDVDDKADSINTLLQKSELDLWDYETVHKYLNSLAQQISSQGSSFYTNPDEVTTVRSPYFSNKHHLLLFKKTGKSWADYAKKVRQDIEDRGKLTPFLQDLVASEFVEADDGDDIDKDEENSGEILHDDELYFPLPSNDEQKRIAHRLSHSYGAVVQGPPGTGKTHTIANIVSRLLAQGKTVLITSQTGQALSVLKQKLPKQIRSLAVSQVETNDKNSDLQASVTEILEKISVTQTEYQKRTKSTKQELYTVRADIAEKQKEFRRKALTDSQEEIRLGSDIYNPMRAAQEVVGLLSQINFLFEDAISHKDIFSLSQKDFDDYIDALTSLKQENWGDWQFNTLPKEGTLPDLKTLNQLFSLRTKVTDEDLKLVDQDLLEERLNEVDTVLSYIQSFGEYEKDAKSFNEHLTNKALSTNEITKLKKSYNDEKLQKLLDTLYKVKHTINSFDTEYERDLLKIAKIDSQNSKWESALTSIDNLVTVYNKQSQILLGRDVSNVAQYESDYAGTLLLLQQIESDAHKNNGRVKNGFAKLLFDNGVAKFLKAVRIDDRNVLSIEDVEVIKAHFVKIKTSEQIKRTWEQLHSDINDSPKLKVPFSIVDVEILLKRAKRAIAFYKDFTEVISELGITGIFNDISIENIDFINEAIEVFSLFQSVYKVDATNLLIKQIVDVFDKPEIHKSARQLGIYIQKYDIENIQRQRDLIESLSSRKLLAVEFQTVRTEVDNQIEAYYYDMKRSHPQFSEYLHAVAEGSIKKIEEFYKKLPNLIETQEKSRLLNNLENTLKETIPTTLKKIRSTISDGGEVSINVDDNVKLKQLESWLQSLSEGDELADISKKLTQLKNKEGYLTADLVADSAWMRLSKRVTKPQKEALASFALSMKKRGAGSGKYAEKHLRDAEQALRVGQSAVPVWIMPINTVHRLFPDPKAGMFDVVIFDEASQLDVRGLSIAYIGKKILVVGDDEQVSPTSFVTQSQITDLITRYISEVPNSHHFTSTSSLFDVAKIKLTDVIGLTEHFRSIKELIGFSNQLAYSRRLKILRDQLPQHRLDPVLEPVYVAKGYEETNQKTNLAEAEAIVERIKSMVRNKKYSETIEGGENKALTYGIISLLGKEQSKLITKLISEQVPHDLIEKHEITCGDPYTFQGDERDIILLSMVKAPDSTGKIMPLTINKKENKQRINVAMSRARNKMILFHSMLRTDLSNPSDLRKQILDWFYDYEGEKIKAGLDIVREEIQLGRASEFEYAVAKHIVERGYEIIPQYEVAQYRIDLVVQGKNAKLAIECDGDQYHNRIEKWDEDIERQQILERAGWTFWRVTGSAFYRYQEKSLTSLWEKLEEMKIYPLNDPRNKVEEKEVLEVVANISDSLDDDYLDEDDLEDNVEEKVEIPKQSAVETNSKKNQQVSLFDTQSGLSPDSLKTRIDVLKLSKDIVKKLELAGLRTVGGIVKRTKSDLEKIGLSERDINTLFAEIDKLK